MKIIRAWAMPSKWTFKIKPIREIIDRYHNEPSVDPFSGSSKIATYRNDISLSNIDALGFLQQFPNESIQTVLYDPPYSITQACRRYGTGFNTKTYWSNVRRELARVLMPDGVAISCGWNSGGLGLKNQCRIIEILLVAHGGGRNDTIVTIERKAQPIANF